MEIFKSAEFYSKFLPHYFVTAYSQFSRNISSSTWVDVTKPFNIYRFICQFIKFVKSIVKRQDYILIIQMLQKQFIIQIHKLLQHHLENSHATTIQHIINSNIPQVHTCLVQLLFHISIIDLRLIIGDMTDKQQDMLIRDMHRLISHIHIVSSDHDIQVQYNQTIQFIITKLIQKAQCLKTVTFIKSVLNKSEMLQKFKDVVLNQSKKLNPQPKSQYIEEYQQIPLKTIEKKIFLQKKQILIEKEIESKKQQMLIKTPQKKTRNHTKYDQSIQKSVRIIPNQNKVAQRTIFQVKNKKFIPKKIQYTVDNTAASSCSYTTSNFQFSVIKRNLYNPKMYKQDINQVDKGILVDATPIKRDKQVSVQSCSKKGDRFSLQNLISKNLKMVK